MMGNRSGVLPPDATESPAKMCRLFPSAKPGPESTIASFGSWRRASTCAVDQSARKAVNLTPTQDRSAMAQRAHRSLRKNARALLLRQGRRGTPWKIPHVQVVGCRITCFNLQRGESFGQSSSASCGTDREESGKEGPLPSPVGLRCWQSVP